MQIKQAANSWKQLTGLLLPNPEKNSYLGIENKKIIKKKLKIHLRVNENGFLKNYREDPIYLPIFCLPKV
jgi:hypothetical protein